MITEHISKSLNYMLAAALLIILVVNEVYCCYAMDGYRWCEPCRNYQSIWHPEDL